MLDRLRYYWLPRLLFAGVLVLAGGLALAVGVAPALFARLPRSMTAVRLFAEDAAVRRTALASALGLTVTAFVFFRPPPPPRVVKKPSKNSPPGNIAGA
jgi:hypothetical protein